LNELQTQLANDIDPTDRFGPTVKIGHLLGTLAEYYQRTSIKNKRRLVALLFPANLIFKDGLFEFGQLNASFQLIYRNHTGLISN